MTDLIKIVGIIALILAPTVGYGMNIWAVFHLDFASPYKAEAIRTVGVFVPPVGAIAGYVTFEEEKDAE